MIKSLWTKIKNALSYMGTKIADVSKKTAKAIARVFSTNSKEKEELDTLLKDAVEKAHPELKEEERIDILKEVTEESKKVMDACDKEADEKAEKIVEAIKKYGSKVFLGFVSFTFVMLFPGLLLLLIELLTVYMFLTIAVEEATRKA
jgi:Fe2+ transport system protein B